MESRNHTTTSKFEIQSSLIDIIAKQHSQNDIGFALKLWRPNPELYLDEQNAIIESILSCPCFLNVVDKLALEGCGSKQDLLCEAKEVLIKMGHSYNLPSIRMLGYFLKKLTRNLYSGVIVNVAGVREYRDALKKGPVLLLPTHRSYADFVLLSYLSYTFDIPLPVVAAGMDFQGMKLINRLLQNAGAFYIRRSFGQDRLYWTIISEYIHFHLKRFKAPLEFFLEGTRSRNGKSLSPKLGLLTMALEPYITSDISDLQVCPVSISYERTLEEILYAYELLGVPKPKESTSGFFSAVGKIWSENYGKIYIHFGSSQSVQFYLKKRPLPNWFHSSTPFILEPDEKRAIQILSQNLIRQQQLQAVIPVFSILTLLLSRKKCSMEQMECWISRCVEFLLNFGATVWNNGNVKELILECLSVHGSKICQTEEGLYYFNSELCGKELEGKAATRLILQHYTNQLLAPVIDAAVYCYINANGVELTTDDLKEELKFFHKYFKEEFVLIGCQDEEDLRKLHNLDAELMSILGDLFTPYVESLYLLLNILDMNLTSMKDITLQYKNLAGAALSNGASLFYEILAADKISRFVKNLIDHCIIRKVGRESDIVCEMETIRFMISRLERYVNGKMKGFISQHRCSSVRLVAKI